MPRKSKKEERTLVVQSEGCGGREWFFSVSHALGITRVEARFVGGIGINHNRV